MSIIHRYVEALCPDDMRLACDWKFFYVFAHKNEINFFFMRLGTNIRYSSK